MGRYPQLNLPSFKFKVKMRDGQQCILDEQRGAWLVLTPEEWVRRHVIKFLTLSLGCDSALIVQEYPVDVQGMPQRADIVLFTSNFEPILLTECKAPHINIDQNVYDQAVRYNSVVGAPYLMLTNGLKHYFYHRHESGEYIRLDSLPNLCPKQ